MERKNILMCETALMMAVVYVVTRFLQIPIPLGYFNVGNCVILLLCTLLPSPYGIVGGSLGSALADLTSYPEYTLPTLIIKAAMPLVFYKLSLGFGGNNAAFSKSGSFSGKNNVLPDRGNFGTPKNYNSALSKWSAKKSLNIVAAALSTLIPLFGYTITGGILYGSAIAALAQFPGLLLEYIANLVIFTVLFVPVSQLRRYIAPTL